VARIATNIAAVIAAVIAASSYRPVLGHPSPAAKKCIASIVAGVAADGDFTSFVAHLVVGATLVATSTVAIFATISFGVFAANIVAVVLGIVIVTVLGHPSPAGRAAEIAAG
jgi:hypothetical protein